MKQRPFQENRDDKIMARGSLLKEMLKCEICMCGYAPSLNLFSICMTTENKNHIIMHVLGFKGFRKSMLYMYIEQRIDDRMKNDGFQIYYVQK